MIKQSKPSQTDQAQSTTLAEVAPVKMTKGLSTAMAEQYQMERVQFLKTIKATCFPDGKATDEQLAAFLIVANEYGLNPFVRQIYAFTGKDGGIVPIVPVDGWAAVVNKNKQYDGCEFEDAFDEGNNLFSTTCIMYRKDRGHSIKVTEYLSECFRKTKPWEQWPARMLRHKAFIQAARLTFSLSGFYDPDEADRIMDAEMEVVSTRTSEEIKADAGKIDQAAADPTPKAKEKPPAEKKAEPDSTATKEAEKEEAPALKMESPADEESPNAEQPEPTDAEGDDVEDEGW